MKKILFCIVALFACAGLFAQNVSLDRAVQTSAKEIEKQLPKGAKAAVLTFTSAKQTFSDYIIEELASALEASKNLQVIDRQHTDAIRKEFNIQFSGDVSDDEIKRVGKQLGAQFVVTGSLVDIGNAYRFRVAAINIETSVREGSSSLNININDPQVTFLLTGKRTDAQPESRGTAQQGPVVYDGTRPDPRVPSVNLSVLDRDTRMAYENWAAARNDGFRRYRTNPEYLEFIAWQAQRNQSLRDARKRVPNGDAQYKEFVEWYISATRTSAIEAAIRYQAEQQRLQQAENARMDALWQEVRAQQQPAGR